MPFRPAHGRAAVIAVLVAAVGVGATMLPAAAAADTTAPPTPSGVVATALDGGGPAQVVFDAEANSLSGLTSSSNASTPTAAAKNGTRGLRLSSTDEQGYARWGTSVVPQNQAYASARFWVRLHSSGAGQSVDLMTVENTRRTANFDFFVSAETQRFQWDLFRADSDESSFVVSYGRWYLVEVQLEFAGADDTATVRIDGVDQGTITSAGADARVRTLSVGAFTTKTHTQDYDDIALQVGGQPLGWLAADQGESGVSVTWDPVTDTGGSGLREYDIWRNGNWYGWVPAGNPTQFLDNNPIAGGYYQVRAIDHALNRSGWSARAYPGDTDTTAPPTPTGLDAQSGPGGVTLTWDPVTDTGGSGLREYDIWRNGNWYGWVPAGNPTQFLDNNPTAGGYYQVRAIDHALNRSGWSAPVSP